VWRLSAARGRLLTAPDGHRKGLQPIKAACVLVRREIDLAGWAHPNVTDTPDGAPDEVLFAHDSRVGQTEPNHHLLEERAQDEVAGPAGEDFATIDRQP
jgi:hypothetical protein